MSERRALEAMSTVIDTDAFTAILNMDNPDDTPFRDPKIPISEDHADRAVSQRRIWQFLDNVEGAIEDMPACLQQQDLDTLHTHARWLNRASAEHGAKSLQARGKKVKDLVYGDDSARTHDERIEVLKTALEPARSEYEQARDTYTWFYKGEWKQDARYAEG